MVLPFKRSLHGCLKRQQHAWAPGSYRLYLCDMQAINNYLSLLGWNEGTEQEVYSLDELKQKFSLDRITKSGAVFDRTKLSWMNGQHLKLLPHDQVCCCTTGSLPS